MSRRPVPDNATPGQSITGQPILVFFSTLLLLLWANDPPAGAKCR